MTVQWRTSAAPVPYPEAVRSMEERVAALRDENAAELVWLLEHPPLYTAGTSADPAELLDPDRFPVYASGRGGRFTYHGPGQRVGYVILDLKRFDGDVRGHVWRLEEWIIRSLADMGVTAVRRAGRVGVWVPDAPDGEAKIAAIGVRVRRWVSYHGIAINVSPDLSHFAGIVPCGLGSYPVTSLAALGISRTMADLDAALIRHFPDLFER